MTTPTIDSSLSGQTTGTVKIPDYYLVLQDIAATLAYKPPLVVVGVGTTTGSLMTIVSDDDIQTGYFVSGGGMLPGTYVTTVTGTLGASLVNVSNTSGDSLGETYTYTFTSPTVVQAQALDVLRDSLLTTGVKAYDPYTLVSKASEYAYFGEHPEELAAIIAKLPSVPNATLDQIKTLLSGVTKL
jgi:hypothetical protein